MKISDYLYNSSDRLALVSLDDPQDFRAYWPLRLTQLVGGKTWSISFVRFQTPKPQVTAQRQGSTGENQ